MSIPAEYLHYYKNRNVALLKRCFDVIFSFIGLLIISPLFVIIALFIKIGSSGSILFKHKRIGYMGEEFEVYKFRTMIMGAEDYTKHLTHEQIIEFRENYKLKNDPRITPIGKFLRNTSLDELPQLFNVLKGDMSLVGPRPIIQEELSKYGEHKEVLLSLKPGITGLWQVNGRSDTTYTERVKLDIEYANNIGLLTDVLIITKTFAKVIIREGVY